MLIDTTEKSHLAVLRPQLELLIKDLGWLCSSVGGVLTLLRKGRVGLVHILVSEEPGWPDGLVAWT